MSQTDLHSSFLSSLTCIAFGFVLKQTGIVHEGDGAALSRLLYGLICPCLVLKMVLAIEIDLRLMIVLATSSMFWIFLLGLARILFRRSDREVRGILMASLAGGSLPFAIPLIEGIWGLEGLQLAFFLDLPNIVVLFGVNYILTKTMSPAAYQSVEDEGDGDGDGEGGNVTTADQPSGGAGASVSASAVAGEITAAVTGAATTQLNAEGQEARGRGAGGTAGAIDLNDLELQPMEVEGGAGGNQRIATAYPRVRGLLSMIAQNLQFTAFAVAMTMNVAGVPHWPVSVDAFLTRVGSCTGPLVLLLLGQFLDLRLLFGEYKWFVAKVLAVRVTLGVGVAVLTYTFMPVDEMVKGITVMLFLTPASNILIRYSILFGYPPKLAGSLVNASTVVSFFLLWGILTLLEVEGQ